MGVEDSVGMVDAGLGDALAETVFKRSYARLLPDGERETWAQCVDRTISFFRARGRAKIAADGDGDLDGFEARLADLRTAMLKREVMPAMRVLWSAGVSTNDISYFNCASVAADGPAVFWEALYVLMHGTGVGYSVEEDVVALMPHPVMPRRDAAPFVHVVGDSKEGWRDAVEAGVTAWFNGDDVVFDYSGVRPKGAPLKTAGGQASGPEPLAKYLDTLRDVIRAAGRQRRGLTTVEINDLLCLAGQAVHVGGVRRSAMIALFSGEDSAMAAIKDWRQYAPGSDIAALRGQVNISSLYADPRRTLSRDDFKRMWSVLSNGQSGEPGFISSARNQWRIGLERVSRALRALMRIGFNPCVEIALMLLLRAAREAAWTDGGGQFCNLTMAVLRPNDTPESAARKVALAAFAGTIQATLTDFRGLRAGWKENTDRDALLGVCLSAHADCPQISTDEDVMTALNRAAVAENERWAPKFGINTAAAVTAVKPDGNSAAVLGCASGFHGHYAPHFIRRVAIDAGSPIAQLLRASGVPATPSSYSEEVKLKAGTITADDVSSWSFEFPRAAPKGALIAGDESAIEQAERYLKVTRSYLGDRGHNASATIYVKPDEWDALGQWVWDHFDQIGGLSFYPVADARYHAAPLEKISAAKYRRLSRAFPAVDWTRLREFETGVSEGHATSACAGGACELGGR